MNFLFLPEIKNINTIEKEQKRFHGRATCTGNLSSIVILPDGKVSICEELYNHPQFVVGDVSTHFILDVWNSEKARSLFYIKKAEISKQSACKACDEFDICRHNKGVCWKTILMAYGYDNWDFPNPRCPHAPEIYNEIYAEPNT